jgi:hypothetical protein
MTPHPERADYLRILDTPVNNVMMGTSMKGSGYSSARPYLVIDMGI